MDHMYLNLFLIPGSPARHVADLPEATPELMVDYTRSLYNHFIMVKDQPTDKRDATAKLVEL